MRRVRVGALVAAAALLTACGPTTAQIVFDSTTRPAPTTSSVTPLGASTTSPTVEVAPPLVTGSATPAASVPVTSTPLVSSPNAPDVTADPGTVVTDPDPAPADCATAGCSGPQLVASTTLTSIPQLGDDPVRGSGCGLAEEFGDSMRDGLYFGLLYPTGDSVAFDVICVYYGDSAVDHGANAGPEAEFFPVNTGTRDRDVPLAAGFVYRVGTWTADGQCVDAGPAGDADWSSAVDGTAAWLSIAGGDATGAVAMCPI